MSAVTIRGDIWRGLLKDEWHVDSPSCEELFSAIRRLDGKAHTMVVIEGQGAQHLAIGGGAGRYVVYATFDNWDYWNLLNATARDGSACVNIGGQEGEYPARQIVDLQQAETAARWFWERVELEPNLQWEKQ